MVCIPTYNERENIELIIPAVREALPQAHILIVDDASPDGTGAVADALALKDAQVHVLHRTEKAGLGPAYLAGFAWALARDYSAVFQFDADFSHQPKYLPELWARLDHADVVIGSRRVEGGGIEDWNAVRRFISWGGSTYARVVLQSPIHDMTAGFNLFRREVLERIGLDDYESSGYGFQIELKHRARVAGFRVVEHPIIFPDRTRGVSKMNWRIFKEAMTTVIRLRAYSPPDAH